MRHQDDSAEAAYRRAIALNPRNAVAHVGLARLHVRRGADAAALNHYRSAIKAAPTHGTYAAEFADCLARIAVVSLDRRTDGAAALRAYYHARTIIPGDANLALRAGRFAREIGRYEEAVICLRDAAELLPKSVEAREELAATYDAIGDRLSAHQARAEARRIEQDRASAEIAVVEPED